MQTSIRTRTDGIFCSRYQHEGTMHLRAVGSRSYSSCAGPAESFVQNRACTEPGRASTSNPKMTVAAASATLVAHFGRPRYTSGVFDCIPRASTCETALEKRRRVHCPILREDARRARTAAQGRDGENGVKDYRQPKGKREGDEKKEKKKEHRPGRTADREAYSSIVSKRHMLRW